MKCKGRKNRSLCQWSIIFNLPNSVGYLRLVLMFLGFCLAFSQPLISFFLISISAWLDMLDGWLARKFNRQTKLGWCFDMLLDRLLEAVFALLLALIFPHYFLLFVFLLALDLSSHFMIIHRTYLYQQASHKTINSAPFLLSQYYSKRFVLTAAVIFYQNIFIFLYLYNYYPQQWMLIVMLICLPGALFKIWINIIQLFYSIKCIAQYDLNRILLE